MTRMRGGGPNAMSLLDLLDALALPWPSKDRRTRRYDRIGCLLGSALVAIVGLIVAFAALGDG